jgi:A/G-specific adenine glycosylase
LSEPTASHGNAGALLTASFSARVIDWQKQLGRHDLPWQGSRDPYRIWVSEIMLQQTQVATVIPYYQTFMNEFPVIERLALAPLDRIMQLWSGLGYYSRARNLHRCAQQVVQQFGGQFPADRIVLESLPGVGRSTAAAICALAFGVPEAILDGNVKRVMARHFGIAGYPGDTAVQKRLWAIAEHELPQQAIEPYTQGLMDLGATVCTRSKPRCSACPVASSCFAMLRDQIALIPASKPRAAIPERYTLLLIIARADQVLLLKRPPTGIWGGLWSLPELPLSRPEFERQGCSEASMAEVRRWLEQQGLAIGKQHLLAAFEHRFTHFRLNILPMRIEPLILAGVSMRVAEPTVSWLALRDVAAAALPKPVKSLLLALMP